MIRLHGIPIWVRDASFDQFCLGPRFQKDNFPFVKMRERKLIGLHAMCEHIERRKTRATTISHGVFRQLENGQTINFFEMVKRLIFFVRRGNQGRKMGLTCNSCGVQGEYKSTDPSKCVRSPLYACAIYISVFRLLFCPDYCPLILHMILCVASLFASITGRE